jgi:antitoxin component YwqK of YwqJK toxin-antitoxin module
MPRMTRPLRLQNAMALAALALSLPAFAIPTCELDGQYINPANGSMTAGKTGLMRCKEADTGVMLREQELRDGKFMGVVRYFKNGQVEREYNVDERGNRRGLSREWHVGGDGKRVLVREETEGEGRSIGVVKTWYPTGEKRRLSFTGEDKREQASVEFNQDGRLSDLRCASQPVFGADFDDKTACGHAGKASTVVLYNAKAQPATRITFEAGERRKVESLWESGAVRELRETSDTGVLERRFAADGTKLREQQWVKFVAPDAKADARPRTVKVLEQQFHESGKLVQETRWKPDERGFALTTSESLWYLNGQMKERVLYEYAANEGESRTRRETRFHDNGKPSFEGAWRTASSRSYGRPQELPFGTHKHFDDQGRVRSERIYDDKGRINREREFDEAGAVVRDDEVFEDGSRKAMSR